MPSRNRSCSRRAPPTESGNAGQSGTDAKAATSSGSPSTPSPRRSRAAGRRVSRGNVMYWPAPCRPPRARRTPRAARRRAGIATPRQPTTGRIAGQHARFPVDQRAVAIEGQDLERRVVEVGHAAHHPADRLHYHATRDRNRQARRRRIDGGSDGQPCRFVWRAVIGNPNPSPGRRLRPACRPRRRDRFRRRNQSGGQHKVLDAPLVGLPARPARSSPASPVPATRGRSRRATPSCSPTAGSLVNVEGLVLFPGRQPACCQRSAIAGVVQRRGDGR